MTIRNWVSGSPYPLPLDLPCPLYLKSNPPSSTSQLQHQLPASLLHRQPCPRRPPAQNPPAKPRRPRQPPSPLPRLSSQASSSSSRPKPQPSPTPMRACIGPTPTAPLPSM